MVFIKFQNRSYIVFCFKIKNLYQNINNFYKNLYIFLIIKDNNSNILAKFFQQIFINKIEYIFTNKYLKVIALSMIYNIYLEKIG